MKDNKDLIRDDRSTHQKIYKFAGLLFQLKTYEWKWFDFKQVDERNLFVHPVQYKRIILHNVKFDQWIIQKIR